MMRRVDAVRWDGTNWGEIIAFAGPAGMVGPDGGLVWLKPGDWLIRRTDGGLFRAAD